jgi:hypothetical protein
VWYNGTIFFGTVFLVPSNQAKNAVNCYVEVATTLRFPGFYPPITVSVCVLHSTILMPTGAAVLVTTVCTANEDCNV